VTFSKAVSRGHLHDSPEPFVTAVTMIDDPKNNLYEYNQTINVVRLGFCQFGVEKQTMVCLVM